CAKYRKNSAWGTDHFDVW
nr:immunoglobulin heavy chain junction region [Macaca mulatta]